MSERVLYVFTFLLVCVLGVYLHVDTFAEPKRKSSLKKMVYS